MILVGNKCDIQDQRQIKKEEGEEYAKKKNIKFYEVSAKEGTNVNEVFEYLVKDILKSYSPNEKYKKRASKMLTVPIKKGKKKKCC